MTAASPSWAEQSSANLWAVNGLSGRRYFPRRRFPSRDLGDTTIARHDLDGVPLSQVASAGHFNGSRGPAGRDEPLLCVFADDGKRMETPP
jgi:hypothetical protein